MGEAKLYSFENVILSFVNRFNCLLCLVDERDYTLTTKRRKLLTKLLCITLIKRCRAWGQISECPQHKHCTRPRPRCYSETRPLQQLAKVVSRRYIAKHTSAWDIVARIALLAQMTDNIIRLHIDKHTCKKE